MSNDPHEKYRNSEKGRDKILSASNAYRGRQRSHLVQLVEQNEYIIALLDRITNHLLGPHRMEYKNNDKTDE